jgi:GWxTD domain-containing protein
MSNIQPTDSDVRYLTYGTSAFLIVLISLCSVTEVRAQRFSEYQKLTLRDQRPPLFFDFFVLPGDTEQSVQLVSAYSFSYGYLPFKKTNQASSQTDASKSFSSPINLNMEVFESNKEQLRKRGRDISVEGLESAGRSFWEDTAYAESYEESQSELKFLQGNVKVNLNPGIYSYVLQMKRGEQSDPQLSRTQAVRLESYPEMETGNILLGSGLSGDQFRLISMGKNVKYGEDFYALAYLPDYDPNAEYSVSVSALKMNGEVEFGSLTVGDQKTKETKIVYEQNIASEDIRTDIKPTLNQNKSKENILELSSTTDGFAYALLKIPNSTFASSFYRLNISKGNSSPPASQTTFRSMWINMPRSLLSLDVSIDMLHYIVDEKTLDQIDSGSREAREQKFRNFWEKQDPTPDTEYNELMAEYYQRIDYAYQNFTTDNTIGYESDQGEIYIKFGPPQSKQRKFPANGSTIEIWTYPNREFVFRATTGFGDFRLVSNQSQ